jgi:hypothetical protein
MGSPIPGTPDRIGHHHLYRILGTNGPAKSLLELDRLYRRSVQSRALCVIIVIVIAIADRAPIRCKGDSSNRNSGP